MLDFGLVREALQERGLLLNRLAPHLVRPVPFLYPLTHRGWERPYVGSGLLLYDAMARFGPAEVGLPRHRHLTRKTVARIAPDFAPGSIAGAIRYYDCQVDDARLVVTLARTAAAHGAELATRVKVTGFLREGERVVGVRAHDLENDRQLEVARASSSTRPASGPTTSRRWSGDGARCTCRRPRASTSSSLATASAPRRASSCAPRSPSSS